MNLRTSVFNKNPNYCSKIISLQCIENFDNFKFAKWQRQWTNILRYISAIGQRCCFRFERIWACLFHSAISRSRNNSHVSLKKKSNSKVLKTKAQAKYKQIISLWTMARFYNSPSKLTKENKVPGNIHPSFTQLSAHESLLL